MSEDAKGEDEMDADGHNSAGDKLLLRRYLRRIEAEAATADRLTSADFRPNIEDLGLLLRHHLLSVPFENLSQHVHPREGAVPQIPVTDLPSLDVHKTLEKIVRDKRGGFCWEVNFAFAWLLRQLGYKVRLANAHVHTPDGPVPGHLCLFADDLNGSVYHVDPGFGDAPRTPLPATLNAPVKDRMLGDEYAFEANEEESSRGRFPVLLKRRRNMGGLGGSPNADLLDENPEPSSSPSPAEPVYYLNFADDLDPDCPEFREGLSRVLRKDPDANLFARKRLCIVLRERGHDYVGRTYWKQVRDGVRVLKHPINSEADYRDILQKVAGIKLR